MSFLNPINESVLRFSSKDAGAPQISYNARAAGDVKAILKACLVTGYGAKSSAGWSVVNEVANVAEFVSPSAAMSDYRLGIDDTSASSTIWYHQYQNVRTNPVKNNPSKTFLYSNTTNTSNGWQLIATALGVYFLEIVYSSPVSAPLARVTYWGRIKSALTSDSGPNISFICMGYEAPSGYPNAFFNPSDSTLKSYSIGSYNSVKFDAANINAIATIAIQDNTSSVEVIDALYLYQDSNFLGEQPGILLRLPNSNADLYGVVDKTFDGRPVLYVCLGANRHTSALVEQYVRSILIYLDYWEY